MSAVQAEKPKKNKEEIFREYLSSRGLKFTRERKDILKALPSVNKHFDFDAEHLLIKAREQELRISRDTIYRTLPLLVESGLIRKVLQGDSRQMRYECVHGRIHHEHLVCTMCHSVTEFVNNQIEKLQDQVCEDYGFKPTSHNLNIFGICKGCLRDQA